jgi:eukaryotic-like serine/threonine-protein kinase
MIDEVQGPLDETEVIEWMRQTAFGLLAAAEIGIVHRDIKPSNIFVDNRRQARVMDFGLSRLDGDSGSITLANSILGTPYYMAPEQIDRPRDVDTRADIYSFGATFYHALTGRPPFEGETALEILFKHKTQTLLPPIVLNPKLSTVTSEFLERCLAKSQNDRFDSFRSVVRFLGPCADSAAQGSRIGRVDISDHLERYQAARHVYLTQRLKPGRTDTYHFPGERRLEFVVDNIVRQQVDAIVSPDSSLLSMEFGCAALIGDAAGEEVRRLAMQFAPVIPGRIVVTRWKP